MWKKKDLIELIHVSKVFNEFEMLVTDGINDLLELIILGKCCTDEERCIRGILHGPSNFLR